MAVSDNKNAEKRLLIFGASGFVGPYLGKEFKSHGYAVFGTDLRAAFGAFDYDDFYLTDILDKQQVESLINEVRPTHIVNLAAISSVSQSWKMPSLTMQINISGTLNILEGCLSIGIKPRILLIGSSEEYIPCPSPIDENTPLNANNPYGISKIAQEQLAKLYRERYEWPIFAVRSFNHIGPGQKPNFVIASWCKQVADIEKGRQEPVIKVGNTAVSRDFSDVRDVVSAYRLVIESEESSEIYNIGSGQAKSLRELLDYICSLSKKRIDVVVDSDLLRVFDNSVICCNNSKVHRKLGWIPKYNLNDTINEMYREFLGGQ